MMISPTRSLGAWLCWAHLCLLPVLAWSVSQPAKLMQFDKITELKGATLEAKEGIDGNYARLGPSSLVPTSKMETPLVSDYTVMAWIRPDEIANEGSGGFSERSPVTILQLSGPDADGENRAQGSELVLRIHKGVLEATFSADKKKWFPVRGEHAIPIGQWTHVTVTVEDGWATLYVNGKDEGQGQVPNDLQFDRVTLGRLGKNRKFIGSLDAIYLYNEAFTSAEVEERFKDDTAKAELKLPPLSRLNQRLGYPVLQVTEETIHPLADGNAIQAIVVPWTGPEAKDLFLWNRNRHMVEFNMGVRQPVGPDPTQPGLPLYGPLERYELKGRDFRALPTKGGKFDLLGNGWKTPWGKGNLIRYRNQGSVGQPKFTQSEQVLIGGQALAEALGEDQFQAFCLGDVDGDGELDLVLTVAVPIVEPYWPDGVSVWKGEHRNSGPGKGYDIAGNWLGNPTRLEVRWAKGTRKNGELVFGEVQPVRTRYQNFNVQWLSYSGDMTPAILGIKGQRYLVLCGDVDKLLALPILSADGPLICGDAQPVLPDGQTLVGTYFYNTICVADLDNDGHDELLISGTPGRIAVVKGKAMGEFREVGTLNERGGAIAVDTLAVPSRVDFDGDGYPDIICGDSSGLLSIWMGTQDPLVYDGVHFFTENGQRLEHRAGPRGSIQGPGEARWGYLNPTVGDWTGDGKVDVIVNDISGDLTLYQQTEEPFALKGTRFTDVDGKPLKVAWRFRPAILDEADGTKGKALVTMDFDGEMAILRPEKKGGTRIASIEKLLGTDGEPLRLSGPNGLWGRGKVAITDWDGDGQWDLLYGVHPDLFKYFLSESERGQLNRATTFWLRNSGTNQKPIFERPRLITLRNGTPLRFGVHNAALWPTDLTGDGQEDLIVGVESGKVYWFRREDLSAPGVDNNSVQVSDN